MSLLYTNEEIDIIKDCYNKHITPTEISKIINRSSASIRNKAYEMKITHPNNISDKDKQYVIDNYKSWNIQEIANHLGMHKTNVCRLARQLGIERTSKKQEITKTYTDENGVSHEKGWVRVTPEEISKARSIFFKQWHKENEHPRGMLGKHHSKEFSENMSKRVYKYWGNITDEERETRWLRQRKTRIKNMTLNPNRNSSNCYSRCKGGKRKDLNDTYFRSAWEANVARYFNHMKIKWEFEPKVFVFDTIKRGSVSYMPDFYLPEKDKWIEVKGWMDASSKTKIKRFAKYYPEEYAKFELIGEKEYKVIEKKYKRLIKGWE